MVVIVCVRHSPLFADPDFADFSQEIGLASLGASDEDIKRLATCYWHSVEFGLMRDQSSPEGRVKAYGAGVLSSFGELEFSCKGTSFFPQQAQGKQALLVSAGVPPTPQLLPWDPKVACVTDYPICTYQPNYFVAESMNDAKEKMRLFCESLPKPFYARYNSLTQSIWVDRAVKIDELKQAEKITYSFE